MKLLIVSANYPPRIGGPASSVPELAERLAEKGHSVKVVTLRFPAYAKTEKKKGFTVHRARHLSGNPKKASALDNIFSVFSMAFLATPIMRRWNPDVVHAHDLNLSAAAAVLAKKIARSKAPLITKYTGDLSLEFLINYSSLGFEKIGKRYRGGKAELPLKARVLDSLQSWLVKKSALVTCPSEFQQKQLLRRGVPGKKTVLLRNAVDLALFNPKKYARSEKFVLFAGRIVPWKGLDELLEAFTGINGTKLKIAGSGKSEAFYRKKARELGLQDKVEFLGGIEHKKMPALISKSVLVVMPSLYDPFPHGMLEVLAMEKPLLAARVCGIPEVVKHLETGYLVRAGSAEELKKGMKELLGKKSLRKKIAKNGRGHVRKNYSWEKLLADFELLYGKAVQESEKIHK